MWKTLKNQNHNGVNQIKNEKPSRNPIAQIARQQAPHQRNGVGVFSCFNYGKPTHMTKICKSRPKLGVAPNAQANLIDKKCSVMIIKINIFVGSVDWWIDTRTYHHVCYDHAFFKTYINDEDKKVMLEDAYTTNVLALEI